MRFVIGVDPGRNKVGLALLDVEGNLIERRLLPRSIAASEIAELTSNRTAVIALGNGTTAGKMALEIKEALRSDCDGQIVMIDEKNSTVEGKRNYLKANRPNGLARLLPLGLRTPERPWDDYVAEVIARRYLKSLEGSVE
jgi:RNase H-fold protein (predicted Holliday junction resolvase)